MKSHAHEVHPAQVAGLFYPAEAASLRTLIADVRTRARPDGGSGPKSSSRRMLALSIPARSRRSPVGPWAKRPNPPRRIVIVGPAHRVAFRGLAIHPAMAWSTPLGEARVARDLHLRLAEAGAASVDARPFAGEHSLEMHLVMLQAMAPAPFEILPILVGDAEPRRVAEALRLVWGGPETVIAISSDLSHFLDRGSADAIDSTPAAALKCSRPRRWRAGLRLPADRGGAAHRRRAGHARERPASGDVGRCRGGSVPGRGLRRFRPRICGLSQARRGGSRASAFNRDGGTRRSGRAHRTVVFARAREGTPVAGADGDARNFRHSNGPRNVTRLHRFAPAPRRPLIEDAMTNAVQSGFSDPRFRPLTEAELEASGSTYRSSPSTAGPATSRRNSQPCSTPMGQPHSRRRPTAGSLLLSVWREVQDGRQFVRHLLTKAGLSGWPDGIEAAQIPGSSPSARRGAASRPARSRRSGSTTRLRCIEPWGGREGADWEVRRSRRQASRLKELWRGKPSLIGSLAFSIKPNCPFTIQGTTQTINFFPPRGHWAGSHERRVSCATIPWRCTDPAPRVRASSM